MKEQSDAEKAVEHWRRVGPELQRIRDAELRAMSEEERLVAIDDLLQLLAYLPPKNEISGLVEQQRIFARLRK